MSVFISYAREDLAYVEQLIALLKQNGVESWYDQHLVGSDDYNKIINQEIENAQAILVILSPVSIHAPGVEREALKAQMLEKKVIPVLINDLKNTDPNFPIFLMEKQYIEVRNSKDCIEKILAALGLIQTATTNLNNKQMIEQSKPRRINELAKIKSQKDEGLKVFFRLVELLRLNGDDILVQNLRFSDYKPQKKILFIYLEEQFRGRLIGRNGSRIISLERDLEVKIQFE